MKMKIVCPVCKKGQDITFYDDCIGFCYKGNTEETIGYNLSEEVNCKYCGEEFRTEIEVTKTNW